MEGNSASGSMTTLTKLLRRGAWLLAIPLVLVAVLVISRGSQSFASDPVALNGSWAPFSRCPVDDPAMLGADGVTNTLFCVVSASSSGSFKLGNTQTTTGPTELQFGIVGSDAAGFTVVSPAGGAIVGAPVDVPGGLLGLMCPSSDPVVASVCSLITDNTVNNVTATVESAGNPSNFNLSGGILLGVPIVTLPIKVHLGNPLLGSTCYIGSDADPILLHPENTDISATSLAISRFDADGTPDPTGELSLLSLSGAVQGDSTFSVPGASGCGTLGVLNSAINSKEGLPSASGNNNIVLNGGKTLQAGLINPGAFVPNAGQRLSADWHAGAAAAPTPCAGACPTATPTATPTAVPVVLPPAPTLGNITSDGTTTTVSGTLAATPSTAYTLTFYSGASCDGLGTGTALGSSEITTDATGAATFAAVLDGFVPAGQSVAATSAAAGVISNSSACARVAARACTGDSDCDGYSDAQEIAAGANAFNYCPIMRADVDGDGGVHLLDLARAASVYGEAVPPAPSRYNQGPAPFDSAINLLDLSKMAAKYNESVGQCP